MQISLFSAVILALLPLVLTLAIAIAVVLFVIDLRRSWRRTMVYNRLRTIADLKTAGLLDNDEAREMCRRDFDKLGS